MRRYLLPLLLAICVVLVLSSAACSRHKTPKLDDLNASAPGEGVGLETPGDEIGQGAEGRRVPLGPEGQGVFDTIYFDYDRSDIRPDQMDRIEKNAQYLVENPETTVQVEGHCDERGTVEYNFALGERRAEAIRAFLVSRGVKAENVDVISKGEEEPAVPGNDEAAWSQNRRVEFVATR